MDGDITRTLVNGVPAINFLERVNQLLIKDMVTTMVLKLLGWSIGYNALQNRCYLSVVKARIRLPRLLGFLYKGRILEEIRGMIGKVTTLGLNTNSRMRGKFAQMAVYINYDKSSTSQVEFESLPMVCFGCGHYGYLKEGTEEISTEELVGYGPWMIVERKNQHYFKENRSQHAKKLELGAVGIRFDGLISSGMNDIDLRGERGSTLGKKQISRVNFNRASKGELILTKE
ncbi:hypothetical protein J1N35_005257 [Gossypium stocksii]|uniref:Zinc knuckle CX2CX4HX4C domain-containing protein n=1 Tax=Gossypium stocksii TaxID=47602 RepID=A0A9D3WDH8_9ROSI|nr:hypothetical protein J1N35_005257 [Gossypium stocksii]